SLVANCPKSLRPIGGQHCLTAGARAPASRASLVRHRDRPIPSLSPIAIQRPIGRSQTLCALSATPKYVSRELAADVLPAAPAFGSKRFSAGNPNDCGASISSQGLSLTPETSPQSPDLSRLMALALRLEELVRTGQVASYSALAAFDFDFGDVL